MNGGGGGARGGQGQGQGVPQDVDRLLRVLRHNMLPIQRRAAGGIGGNGDVSNGGAENGNVQGAAGGTAGGGIAAGGAARNLTGDLVPSFVGAASGRNAGASLSSIRAAANESGIGLGVGLLERGSLMGDNAAGGVRQAQGGAHALSSSSLPSNHQLQSASSLNQQLLLLRGGMMPASSSGIDTLRAANLVSMLSKPPSRAEDVAPHNSANALVDAALLGYLNGGSSNLLPSANGGNLFGLQQSSNLGFVGQLQQQRQRQLQQANAAAGFQEDDSQLFKALATNLSADPRRGGASTIEEANDAAAAANLSLSSLPSFGGQGLFRTNASTGDSIRGGLVTFPPNDSIAMPSLQALAQQQRLQQVQNRFNNSGNALLNNTTTKFKPDASSASATLSLGGSDGKCPSRPISRGNSDDKANDGGASFGKHSDDQPLRFKPFHEEKWSRRLEELRLFRKQHGNCLVPHTYPRNPQLARWVKRQRRQYKLLGEGKVSTMTAERVALLDEAGFVWDSHEASWREKIVELRRYRVRQGNCLVPSNYRPDPSLAVWVKCQRRQYKLYQEGKPSAMNDERIRELEGEGFCWEVRGLASSAVGGALGGTNESTMTPPHLPVASKEIDKVVHI